MKKQILILFLIALQMPAFAKITLPSIVGDNMVLQRNSEIAVWGWATAGSTISLNPSWSTTPVTITTDDSGEWRTMLTTPAECVGQQIEIVGDGSSITLRDILIGEVWICSGQSNMDMELIGFGGQMVEGATQTILEARNYPNIRLFVVPRNSCDTPQRDCIGGEWLHSTPDNVAKFSAVGYHFGRSLSVATDLPIGLIETAWGGSRIEAWIPKEVVDSLEDKINIKASYRSTEPNGVVGALYNGMIAPIAPYTARGFIWYQGEANREQADDYLTLMENMVRDWRQEWSGEAMPFYYVQLAPFLYGEQSTSTTLMSIVETQIEALKVIPHSGIASTTDIGHKHTIHPPKKREVGQRLAYLALRNDYGMENLPLPAPTFKSMKVSGNEALISMNNVDAKQNSYQVYEDGEIKELRGFEVAGADKVFYPAECTIEKRRFLRVSSSKVDEIVAVRYGYYNFSGANITTTAGQPLLPFRTDNW